MNENKMDIFIKYNHEINKIHNLLRDLEAGRVYEAERLPGIPKCSTLASHLEEAITDLLHKIQNNEDGLCEKLSKAADGILKK